MIIGGLFAVIALNFTVNSVYQVLGSGDNPVSRLFALNYVALGVSLLVNVLLFRFGVVERGSAATSRNSSTWSWCGRFRCSR